MPENGVGDGSAMPLVDMPSSPPSPPKAPTGEARTTLQRAHSTAASVGILAYGIGVRNLQEYMPSSAWRHRSGEQGGADPLKVTSSEAEEVATARLGDAIRDDRDKAVNIWLRALRPGTLDRLTFSFAVSVERLGPSESDGLGDYNNLVGFELPATRVEEATMTVSPLQLAVLSGATKALSAVLSFLEREEEGGSREAVVRHLEKKARLDFNIGGRNEYGRADLEVDRANAFHMAARFSPLCLGTLADFVLRPPTEEQYPILTRNDAGQDMLGMCKSLLTGRDAQDNPLSLSPLHLAAENPDPSAVAHLLRLDVDVDPRDARGYTPLHLAVRKGRERQVAELLRHGAGPNAVGGTGDSDQFKKAPLHRAWNPKVVDLLLRHRADPFQRTPNTESAAGDGIERRSELSAFELLLARNPEAALALLDNCVAAAGRDDLNSRDLCVVFDLRLFQEEAALSGEQCHDDRLCLNDEMSVHEKMVFLKQREMLKHPLAETYLHLKWEQTKKFFFLNILAFALFTFSLTGLAIFSTLIVKGCDDDPLVFPGETEENEAFSIRKCLARHPEADMAYWIFFYFTLAATCIFFGRELTQWIFAGPRYCWRERENYLELLLIVLTASYLGCLFLDARLSAHPGALAVFLAWIDMTLLLGRVPAFGIYIYMSVHVIRLLLLFFLVYSTTLLAFAFAFFILLPKNDNFYSPHVSFLKVLCMMLGEFDYSDNFRPDEVANVDGSNFTTQLLFMMFFFMVSIILANLIIGLTVSKIEELFKQAGVIRLEKTVLQLLGLENILVRGVVQWFCCCCAGGRRKMEEWTLIFPWMAALAKKTSSKTASLTKVCVRPFQSSRYQEYYRGRGLSGGSVVAQSDGGGGGGGVAGFLGDQPDHEVFLLDEYRSRPGPSLNTKIPDWIVRKALDILYQRRDTEEKERMELS